MYEYLYLITGKYYIYKQDPLNVCFEPHKR